MVAQQMQKEKSVVVVVQAPGQSRGPQLAGMVRSGPARPLEALQLAT